MDCTEVKIFREKLKKACEVRGSVTRLAAAAGTNRVYIHALIRGKGEPSISIASRISRALGTSLAEMISDGEEKYSRQPVDSV